MPTETNPAVDFPAFACIVDLDPCDASNELCERYAVADMTVAEFNAAMREFAAEKLRTDGGYAKLRGTLLFQVDGVEKSLGFRIDVDRNMSEGATISERMAKSAAFYRTDRGVEYARACKQDATEAAELYEQAARATAV